MRQVFEYAKMAVRNIVTNKLRSLLTMLGIIIGIAAVILVLCIGNGSRQTIEGELAGISNGSVYIMPMGDDVTAADYITTGDLQSISEIPGMAGVTMLTGMQGTCRGLLNQEIPASLNVGNAALNEVMPTTLLSGRFWNISDYAAGLKVCTIDAEGAIELFGSDNVVGMTVDITLQGQSAQFTIVGVTKSQQINFGSVTAHFTAPISSLASISNAVDGPFYQIALLAQTPEDSYQLAMQAVTVLELRHGNAGRDVYFVVDVGQYMSEFNNVMNLFTTVIAVVAGISLLVGGIGVMNIMLVSVTERTREIGIRKALGAKTRTILFQFLVESAALTLLGGVIGIILGVWGGAAIGSLLDIPAYIGWDLVLYITLFSSGIGIFFGLYPARKAARLNPIEALRNE